MAKSLYYITIIVLHALQSLIHFTTSSEDCQRDLIHINLASSPPITAPKRRKNLIAAPSDFSMATTNTSPSTTHSFEKWRKWVSFGSAVFSCLCAASIVLFSMWAPAFQQKLGYSQMQVNAISIAGELGLYLPVPIFGYICDNCGPHRLSIISASFFGFGYTLASFCFSHDLSYQVMVIAFALVGMGTSSMYFSAVTTCAKNFTSNRGLALSLPIASFGLSSLWQSQLVSRVFVDANGVLLVNVVFVAYAVLLTCVGLVGGLCLQVFPSEGEAVGAEERERLLQTEDGAERGYGSAGIVGGVIDDEKPWINTAIRGFLQDKTMWLFATSIFLVTGAGEAFINNMGTLIHTLTPPTTSTTQIDTATHVSIIAMASTASRILAGIISDYLAPPTTSSIPTPADKWLRPHCSRMVFLILSGCLLLTAHLLLSFSYIQLHPSQFWLISSSIGAGYGAFFTIAPTVVSVVWGTENFGTHWGVVCMTPALGATAYGVLYASVYDSHAGKDGRCFGIECYRVSFAVMAVGTAVAIGGWGWAWREWRRRCILV